MAEATHTIINMRDEKLTRDLENSANKFKDEFMPPRELRRAPDRYIYVFTTSKREFTRSMPPSFPFLVFPACGVNERYKLVTRLNDPFWNVRRDAVSDELIASSDDACLVAADLINPNNPTLNQDRVTTDGGAGIFGQGMNLARQGVFWSLNEVPTEEELGRAKARLEAYYQTLLQQARSMQAQPAKFEAILAQNQDFHHAAEYFKVSVPWHQTYTAPKVECPNCGDEIKDGISYHRTADGVCVIDWQRAVEEAGVKTYAEVPAKKRWWDESKEHRLGSPLDQLAKASGSNQ